MRNSVYHLTKMIYRPKSFERRQRSTVAGSFLAKKFTAVSNLLRQFSEGPTKVSMARLPRRLWLQTESATNRRAHCPFGRCVLAPLSDLNGEERHERVGHAPPFLDDFHSAVSGICRPCMRRHAYEHAAVSYERDFITRREERTPKMFRYQMLTVIGLGISSMMIPTGEAQACRQHTANGIIRITQDNGFGVTFNTRHDRDSSGQILNTFYGNATSSTGVLGTVQGNISMARSGNGRGSLSALVRWHGGAVGQYQGMIDSEGRFESGYTDHSLSEVQFIRASWSSPTRLGCAK